MENKSEQLSENHGFNKASFLESFVQYKLTPEAEADFRAYAKQGAKADKDIIEKNVSLLIHTSNSKTELPHNKSRYQFAGFVILTSEDEHTIDVVYWVNKKLPVTKAMNQELQNKFSVFGLDHTGFAYLSDTAEAAIEPDMVSETVVESTQV